MLTRRTLGRTLLGGGLALTALPALGATPPVYAENGVAIRGTDPVAYFDGNGPVAGRADLAVDWNGARWRFASAANRDAFAADPARFAPQYGGYCAFAVSRGYTATTEPEAWHIHEGRLYLNFSLRVRTLWRRDIPGNIRLANGNWPGVLA